LPAQNQTAEKPAGIAPLGAQPNGQIPRPKDTWCNDAPHFRDANNNDMSFICAKQ